jgi:beta-carotene hydroxylase
MSARTPEIKIDRRWVGAAESAFNPTVALFLVSVAGYAAGVASAVAGALPLWAAVPLLAVCIYAGFTVLHEAMHGIAHRSKRIGNAMGWVWGILLLIPLPLFRGVHYAHHAHTNDPERDPDLFCAAGPGFLRPLTLLAVPLAYRWHFYKGRLWRDRASLRTAIVVDVALLAFLVWAFASGPAAWVGWLWLAPAALAVLCLALAFDYVPHYPLTQQGRYYDTRIYPGRIANGLLLGQNYHLIHHLWNTIPWYRYREVFEAKEAEFRERGCAIGWSAPALAPISERRAA